MESTEMGQLLRFEEAGFRWLVVRTKPRQEKIAASHLEQRSVHTYCPMYLEPPWHKRAPRGPVPLFTSYVFAWCRPKQHLNAVRYCPGVYRPVTFDGKLATVSPELIDELRLREGERGFILHEEVETGIQVGRQVRLMAGPLQGLEGVFKGYLRGGERAQVLLSLLRSENLVEVDSASVAIARA
jgi:transcription antitermination factor NusG